MLDGVETFYNDLPSGYKDLFIDLFRGFVEDCKPQSLDKIDDKIAKLKRQIDRINIKRGLFSTELSKVDSILNKLDSFIKSDNNNDLEVLRAWLNSYAKWLKRMIVELKPLRELKEKYELKLEKQDLMERRRMGQIVLDQITTSGPENTAEEKVNSVVKNLNRNEEKVHDS